MKPASSPPTRGRIVNPWPILALAALTLILDQWSKVWVIDNLASPVHPMTVVADGERTVADLLATRGIDAAELEVMAGRRHVWIYRRAKGLKADQALSTPGTPQQLIALEATGFPPPRRMRVFPADQAATLGELAAKQWRIDADAVQAVLDGPIYAARDVAAPALVPGKGHLVAVLSRDIEWIPSFMKLVYAENPGAAWGFMRDASPSLRKAFFSAIALLASIGMIWAIFTGWMGTALGTWALGPVLGGALGNLVDRNLYNIVVDFILNYVGEHRWPVYNVADIGITVGVILILLELFLSRGQEPAEVADKAESSGPSAA